MSHDTEHTYLPLHSDWPNLSKDKRNILKISSICNTAFGVIFYLHSFAAMKRFEPKKLFNVAQTTCCNYATLTGAAFGTLWRFAFGFSVIVTVATLTGFALVTVPPCFATFVAICALFDSLAAANKPE